MATNIRDLKLDSPAFGHHGEIPARHSGEGEDLAPEMRWSGVPAGTRQLALVCHDPDAPLPEGFTHWLVYGIPPDAGGIPEGGGRFTEGRNDFGNEGYNGPSPPAGHGRHHYYFWLYALDTEIAAGPGLTRAELLELIADHVIEQARMVGTYRR
jgi:Raf kinase inhibitor-like YbhB/YbcL family protein